MLKTGVIILALCSLSIAPDGHSSSFDCSGCLVSFSGYPTGVPLGGSVSSDLPDFPGHGICFELLGCITDVPCSQSVTVTVDAGPNNIVCDPKSRGQTANKTLAVYGCGDSMIWSSALNCPAEPGCAGPCLGGFFAWLICDTCH